MANLLHSRWFQLANLLLALLSGAVWYFWPQAGAWPLLIALLPFAARVVTGRFPFQSTVFDLPLILFLLTAGIGVWTAYQRDIALAKFWIIVAAILLYYAASELSTGDSWLFAGLLGLAGVVIGSLFLLTHDWQVQPNDLSLLNELGRRWMFVRPSLGLPVIDHNQAGGLLAMCLAFPFAMVGQAWRENKRFLAAGASGTSFLIIFLLLMTNSHGAWLASLVGFGAWLLWEVSVWIARYLQKSRSGVFFLLLLVIVGIPALVLTLQYREEVFAFVQRFPGGTTEGNRLPLFIDTLHLIDDFSISGGGLGSFPGLYSQYIKLLPFFLLGHSHNFYLDIFLEQGIFGLISVVIVYVGSIWLVINRWRDSQAQEGSYLLNWAILTSLIIVILHGLVDDPLYGEKGTTLIFLLSGLSVAISQSGRVREAGQIPILLKPGRFNLLLLNQKNRLLGISLVVVLLILFLGIAKPVQAELYSNLGAVQMAQSELSSFPTRKWVEDTDVSNLQPAKYWFERALVLDPNNETSHYRLGLIALQAREYQNSQRHLELAHASDLDHPGLRKSLGYSYLWSGKLASAAYLLKEVPEADHELLVYIGWWKNRGKTELSNWAISCTLLLRLARVIDQENYEK